MIPMIIYLLILNIVGLFSMGIDKRKAIHHQWRIPESTLFLFSILGGSLGSLLGMKMFHHKTKHLQFTLGIPLIFLLQLLAGGYLYYHW